MNPGVGIRRNFDDDDGDGILDDADYINASEDDLIRLDTNFSVPDPGVEYHLRTSDPNLKVWYTKSKDVQPFIGEGDNVRSVNNSIDKEFWVEWGRGIVGTQQTISIEVVDGVSGNIVEVVDAVNFKPYNGIAVIFMGEFQTPSDPAGAGIMQLAIDLHSEGYDVFAFNEPDHAPPNEETYALDELKDAVVRGQTKISIMGYSHGGGSTLRLSNTLASELGSGGIGSFTIPFTAYIDAVRQDYLSLMPPYTAEIFRPNGSQFHVNQYQLKPGITNIRGTATIGGTTQDELDIDRTSLGVDHGTIDDNPTVINTIKTNFRSRFPKW